MREVVFQGFFCHATVVISDMFFVFSRAFHEIWRSLAYRAMALLFRCNFARRVDAGNDGKIVVGRAWQFDLHKKASAQMPRRFFH